MKKGTYKCFACKQEKRGKPARHGRNQFGPWALCRPCHRKYLKTKAGHDGMDSAWKARVALDHNRRAIEAAAPSGTASDRTIRNPNRYER
jgi:hypothetical protein